LEPIPEWGEHAIGILCLCENSRGIDKGIPVKSVTFNPFGFQESQNIFIKFLACWLTGLIPEHVGLWEVSQEIRENVTCFSNTNDEIVASSRKMIRKTLKRVM